MRLLLVVNSVLGAPLCFLCAWFGLRRDSRLDWIIRAGLLLMATGFAIHVLQVIEDPTFDDLWHMSLSQFCVRVGMLVTVCGWLAKPAGDYLRRVHPADWREDDWDES